VLAAPQCTANTGNLQTKAGKAVYAERKTIVEPVFGQIKQARGFRQFLLRGIEKARGEWSLICLTHNDMTSYVERFCDDADSDKGDKGEHRWEKD
jgi:Transposase DDE domain